MDETMMRKISNILHSLQAHVLAAYNSAVETAEIVNEETQMMIYNIYSCALYDGIKRNIVSQLNKVSALTKNTWETVRCHVNFAIFRHYYSFCSVTFTKWNSSHFYAGCIGLCIGGGIGIIVGLNYYPHIRYIVPMKAIITNSYNGIRGITSVDEVLMPNIISSNEILVHVKAASIDIIDVQIANGYGRVLRHLYQTTIMRKKREFPIIMGRDCSGVVVEVGCNVKRFEVGDEVWLALPYWTDGTMATYIVVNDCYASLKPKILDFERSAAIPYSGCIAWDAVCHKAKLNAISAYNKRYSATRLYKQHSDARSSIVSLLTCVTNSPAVNVGFARCNDKLVLEDD